jgi:hypothetical protein
MLLCFKRAVKKKTRMKDSFKMQRWVPADLEKQRKVAELSPHKITICTKAKPFQILNLH